MSLFLQILTIVFVHAKSENYILGLQKKKKTLHRKRSNFGLVLMRSFSLILT